MKKLLLVGKRVIALFLVNITLITGLLVGFPGAVLAGDIVIDCNSSSNPNCGNNVTYNNGADLAQATGFVTGLVGDIAAISGMGSVAGLGSAGITSGLAAIGSLVGGGMVAGIAVTAVVPTVTALAVGAGIHYLTQSEQSEPAQ